MEQTKRSVRQIAQIASVDIQEEKQEQIERDFEGKGYGAFKPAVGEAVVEALRPIQDETNRILKDKAYLESVYKAGAEKAGYIANKTLRKVYKKIGFEER